MHPNQAKKLLRAIWILSILMVVVGSLLPGNALPMRVLDLHINDKCEHLFAYAVLAFLPTIHEKRVFVVAAAVGAVALGVALEFGQLFLGWRNFEIADMIADTVGVGVGLASGVKMRSMEVLRYVFRSR